MACLYLVVYCGWCGVNARRGMRVVAKKKDDEKKKIFAHACTQCLRSWRLHFLPLPAPVLSQLACAIRLAILHGSRVWRPTGSSRAQADLLGGTHGSLARLLCAAVFKARAWLPARR